MADDSKILTDLAVDDPVAMASRYRFNEHDRRYIDNQIRGCEQHLVDCVIGGVRATYARLHSSSAAVVPGDTVCLTTPVTSVQEVTVTKSTLSALQAAKAVFGVVIQSAAPGGFVRVATSGALPPTLTNLTSNNPGYVRANPSTSACELVSALGPGDFAVGSVLASGWLQIDTGNQQGLSTLSTPDNTPLRIRRYPVADSSVVLIRAILKAQNADASKYAEYEVKAAYRRSGGTLSQLYAPEIVPIIESDAALDVTITLNGNTDVDINVVGLTATVFTWTISELFI